MLRTLLIGLLIVTVTSAQRTPRLSLSETRIQNGRFFEVHGMGFSPKRYALSHLRKPDGLETQVRRFLTDENGEYFHRIDTTMLDPGTHELWSIDEDSGAVSNTARFEVTYP
jgi:hypothetical protein